MCFPYYADKEFDKKQNTSLAVCKFFKEIQN